MRFLGLSYHPGTTCPPSNGGERIPRRDEATFPSAEGCPNGAGWFIPWRRQMCIHTYRCCLYRTHPLVRTLCTNRRGWMRYNWWLCRQMYSPMGMNCSRCPYNPLQPQHNRTDTTWTAPRQMMYTAQSPKLIQLFVSSSPPLVRK